MIAPSILCGVLLSGIPHLSRAPADSKNTPRDVGVGAVCRRKGRAVAVWQDVLQRQNELQSSRYFNSCNNPQSAASHYRKAIPCVCMYIRSGVSLQCVWSLTNTNWGPMPSVCMCKYEDSNCSTHRPPHTLAHKKSRTTRTCLIVSLRCHLWINVRCWPTNSDSIQHCVLIFKWSVPSQ